jgi:hypothetical protein
MRFRFMVGIIVVPALLVTSASTVPSAQDATKRSQAETTQDAMAFLRSLEGNWEGTLDDQSVKTSYRYSATGDIVVNTLFPGTPFEMLTIFHPDGSSVIATHYCAEKNQPRLRLASASSRRLEFDFLDITNLASPDTGHMRRLVLTLEENGEHRQQWTNRSKGEEGSGTFVFRRAK